MSTTPATPPSGVRSNSCHDGGMRSLCLAAGLAVLLVPSIASADPPAFTAPSLGPPRITWLGPWSVGDANGAAGDTMGPSVSLFEPLRLSLLSMTPPNARALGMPCESDATASRSLATDRSAGLELAPGLALMGFGREGCPTDGALGGGVVHVVPIRPNIFLATSAGYVVQPQPHATQGYSVGADLVFRREGGRSVSVGVAVRRGTPTLTLGGVL